MNGSKESANGNDRPGATAAFPYDRTTVELFRETFLRARWNDDLKAWFVPFVVAASTACSQSDESRGAYEQSCT
ncbi:hypothetical protein [Mesorhizobium sp. Root102]|uniref:hypothetical protein n=1 Tax=Mesorhizobium sp. Root102 TaxID=1736422 RepID=UPI0009E83AA5|nr:hypothetical protein [Mesorhizobium sp. Root102]